MNFIICLKELPVVEFVLFLLQEDLKMGWIENPMILRTEHQQRLRVTEENEHNHCKLLLASIGKFPSKRLPKKHKIPKESSLNFYRGK